MVAVQHHYVRPTADDLSETVLTEECRIQTGMNEEAIKNAQPLEHVLDEVCVETMLAGGVCTSDFNPQLLISRACSFLNPRGIIYMAGQLVVVIVQL